MSEVTEMGLTAHLVGGGGPTGPSDHVADTANARVLRFSRPDSSGQAADLVLGQADFTTGTACGFFTVRTVSARSLCSPEGVAMDRQGDVLVSDALDNRVLGFNGPGREEDDEGSEG